ncbi:MAG TPA: hypothetical protein VMU04_16550 [Candidatus Acidoferrum sp.]|nr:hypothetical protein [Candidatus Acidoferrum sp.]
MKTRLYYTVVVGTAIAMSNMRVPARTDNQPAITAVTDNGTPKPVRQALSLLPAQPDVAAADLRPAAQWINQQADKK